MSELSGRLSWQLEVYRLLNESTRPVGENQPMLTAEEQAEMKRCWIDGWSPSAYAQLLIDRDLHLEHLHEA